MAEILPNKACPVTANATTSKKVKLSSPNGTLVLRSAYVQVSLPGPNLNHLPDLCLLSILNGLPLIDLLQVNRVCKRWYHLQRVVCQRKTVLRIYSYYEYDYGYWTPGEQDENVRERLDLLRFFELDPHKCDFILVVAERRYRRWLRRTDAFGRKKNPDWPWERYLFVVRNDAVKKLCHAFPNIKQLVLFDPLLHDHEIVRMMYHWSNSLTSLTIARMKIDFNW